MSYSIDEFEGIQRLMRAAHHTAAEKGWYDDNGTTKTFGDMIALMHEELAEAYREYRDDHGWTIHRHGEESKPEGVPVEFADVLIRIFDTCEYFGMDLAGALEQKMAYNKTRPYRHGGKRT